MVARGEVGLVIATILNGAQVISPQQYVISVVVIVLTTIATPVMLAIGFARLQVVPLGESDYALNLGLFNSIGTTQMFNIIVGQIEKTGYFKTSIQFSEGSKVVNLEGHNVKLILRPEEGIVLKGNRDNIDEIVRLVKNAIMEDLEVVSVR